MHTASGTSYKWNLVEWQLSIIFWAYVFLVIGSVGVTAAVAAVLMEGGSGCWCELVRPGRLR